MQRIICIDPDADRAEEPVKVHRSAGYEVMLASTPEVGMALLRLFPPDIVLLDSHLSEQLLPKTQLACPSATVVLTGENPITVEDLQWLTRHQRAGAQTPDARHLPH